MIIQGNFQEIPEFQLQFNEYHYLCTDIKAKALVWLKRRLQVSWKQKQYRAQGVLYPSVNYTSFSNHIIFVTMKTMTSTNNNNRKATFVYSTLLNDILTDTDGSRMGLNWNARKFRESYLSTLKNRDKKLECRLMAVNTLLMEYHLHHREVITYINEWYNEIYTDMLDDDPALSKATLLKAKDYNEIILQSIFKDGQVEHVGYAVLAVSLMLEIYRQLKNHGIHLNPKRELQCLLCTINRNLSRYYY